MDKKLTIFLDYDVNIHTYTYMYMLCVCDMCGYLLQKRESKLWLASIESFHPQIWITAWSKITADFHWWTAFQAKEISMYS